MSLCIVYLASPRHFRVGAETRLTMLRSSLTYTRHCFPTTDIYVFHEDYTEEDKASLPGVTAFLPVDFRGMESVYTPTLAAPYGYLMMCRFFCGGLQSHPALQSYTHIMRLDDDSFFLPPYPALTPELFAYDYIYRSVFWEPRDQQSLFDFTVAFLERQLGPVRFLLRKRALFARLQERGILRGERYTGFAPYNNFHIASRRLWTHPLVQSYLREIEARQGILREGWLDANIHAMILYVLAPFHEFLWTSFGYRHNLHVSELGGPYCIYDGSLSFFPPALSEQV